MFFKNYETTIVKNTKTVNMHCNICDNDSDHIICAEHVVGMGLIFLKNPVLSVKRYWFVCPVCKQGNKKISKDQMKAYKIK